MGSSRFIAYKVSGRPNSPALGSVQSAYSVVDSCTSVSWMAIVAVAVAVAVVSVVVAAAVVVAVAAAAGFGYHREEN